MSTRIPTIKVLADALPQMMKAMLSDGAGHEKKPLGGITEKVAQHLNAEICSIFLLDTDGMNLTLKEAHGYGKDAVGRPHEMEKGITPIIVREKKEFVLNYNVQDPSLGWVGRLDKELEGHCWSLLGVPIVSSDGQSLGALKLENRRKAWGPKTVGTYLKDISEQIATPKEVVRLLAQLPPADNCVRRMKELAALLQQTTDNISVGALEQARPASVTDEERLAPDEVSAAVESMRWSVSAIAFELTQLDGLDQRHDDDLEKLGRITHSLRLALDAYYPFNSEDLYLSRAVASMIAAALDIDRIAYFKGWERIAHSLDHIGADFLEHLTAVVDHTVAQKPPVSLMKRLEIVYRSGIYMAGTRGLFEAKPDSDKRPHKWPGAFIINQIESRLGFYHRYGHLLGRDIDFNACETGGDVEFQCDIEKCLAALDVIVDNAFLYGAGAVRLELRNDEDILAIAVRNEGSHLPSNFQIARGNRFPTSARKGKRPPSGVGIGLYNSVTALRSFGATVSHRSWKESEKQFTEFCLELPAVKPEVQSNSNGDETYEQR